VVWPGLSGAPCSKGLRHQVCGQLGQPHPAASPELLGGSWQAPAPRPCPSTAESRFDTPLHEAYKPTRVICGWFIPTLFACSSVGSWTPSCLRLLGRSCLQVMQQTPKSSLFFCFLPIKPGFRPWCEWFACWFNVTCKDVCKKTLLSQVTVLKFPPPRSFYHLASCIFVGCSLSPSPFLFSVAGRLIYAVDQNMKEPGREQYCSAGFVV